MKMCRVPALQEECYSLILRPVGTTRADFDKVYHMLVGIEA